MSFRSRSMLLGLVLALCACGSPTSPSSRAPGTFYVSTTGSDRSGGTATAPWQTLQYAVGQLIAGDTLYIRGGTYMGLENRIDDQKITVPNGTSWANAVTIAGYPGETVILQNPDGTDAIHLSTTTHQYIIFRDFIVDGSLGTNSAISAIVFLEGSTNHIRFQSIEIKDAWYSGVNDFTSTGGFNEWLNVSIHGCGRQPDTGVGGDGNSGDGYYGKSNNTVLDHLTVYNNHGYGVYINYDGNIVRNSLIYNNGGILGPGQGLGTNYGIDIGAGAYPHSAGNQIYNNLIYGNRGGMLIYTNSSNTDVHDNTIYSNTPGEGIRIEYATSARVQNNVIYGNATDIVDLGTGTFLANNHP